MSHHHVISQGVHYDVNVYKTEESHSIMAAPADVITPTLEGSSLEVLDPQLPEETEHETNMPVPIAVTKHATNLPP